MEKGIRYMVISLSIFALVGIYLTVFFVPEKKYAQPNTTSNPHFLSSLKSVLGNKSFVYYLFGLLFFFTGFNILRASMKRKSIIKI